MQFFTSKKEGGGGNLRKYITINQILNKQIIFLPFPHFKSQKLNNEKNHDNYKKSPILTQFYPKQQPKKKKRKKTRFTCNE